MNEGGAEPRYAICQLLVGDALLAAFDGDPVTTLLAKVTVHEIVCGIEDVGNLHADVSDLPRCHLPRFSYQRTTPPAPVHTRSRRPSPLMSTAVQPFIAVDSSIR